MEYSGLWTPLARRRVLVVEDEYFIADDVAEALQQLGAEILGPASTPQTALRLIESTDRIDLAVLDVTLSGETVFPVAEELKRRKVPFILATGYDRSSLPPAYRDAIHWEKPFDPAALANALPALLPGSAAEPTRSA